MVLTISEADFMAMKAASLDSDGEESLKLIKEFLKRLEQQGNSGLKSHLG
ncbi:MAG: hypothetical protein V1816_21395 [Pseudomonadota bacterium]